MSAFALLLLMPTLVGQVPSGPEPPTIEPRDDMVLKWNGIALQAVRAEQTPPPVVARNLAIMHLAIFDAVNAVERTHRPFLVCATPEADASPEAAAVAAAHRTLTSLFPRQKAGLDGAFDRCVAELPPDDGRAHGIELGRFVADRVLAWRANDGAERTGQYQVKARLGFWEPTLPALKPALLPDWGYVEPFAMRKGTMYCPAGPPALGSDAYARALDEVKVLGRVDSPVRTAEQTQIARFWADDIGTSTPPGHWNEIARTVARQRRTTLAQNARVFALLNISLVDAGILCWVHKFTYEFWRPLTGIRRAAEDGNPDTQPDPDWMPLLNTPPFPAYISGHSTFSGAAATTLANLFGDANRFTSTSEGLPGVARSYTSFRAAADEAGQSRIYGGIHWQFDNTDGLAVGRTLGDYVTRNYLTPLPPCDRPPVVMVLGE